VQYNTSRRDLCLVLTSRSGAKHNTYDILGQAVLARGFDFDDCQSDIDLSLSLSNEEIITLYGQDLKTAKTFDSSARLERLVTPVSRYPDGAASIRKSLPLGYVRRRTPGGYRP
jgi:hypothetical protein